MNESTSCHASRSEAWQKQAKNIFLGPCFDLTLSASEAIQLFDERSKLHSDSEPPAAESPMPDDSN